MRESGYLKFILTILTLAVIISNFLIIQSLDRIRHTNIIVTDKLDELSSRSVLAPVTEIAAKKTVVPAVVANREFFDPEAVNGGRMIQAITSDPPTLNYLICNESSVAMFNGLCSATLGARNWSKPEQFEPLMAKQWKISPNHLSYHVELRRGILWQEYIDPVSGIKIPAKEVTAHDFKFFEEVIKNPEVNCAPLRVYYQDLAGVEVVDDYNFIVRWKRAYYGSIASTLGMSPLPRHFYAPEGKFNGKLFNGDSKRNSMIISCGPYRLVSWERDKKLIFRRNPQYFGNALGVGAHIEYLQFDIIKLPNTRFQALLGGKLDHLGLTPEQWVRRSNEDMFTSGKLKRYKYLLPNYYYIGYNLRNPRFNDRRTRQALTMLINREKIRQDVYYGLAETVTGPFFIGGVYNNPKLKPWPYDPEKAKKLLEDAGWRDVDGDGILERDGLKFVFTMLQIAGSVNQSKMMPVIKESLAVAGIDMKIQNVEWSVYIQRLDQRNYDACSLGWASTFDPDLYQIWHSSQMGNRGSNHIGYSNSEVDRLIEEMRICFDLNKRIALAHKLGEILHEDQPYTFLFTPYSLVAQSARYRNVRVFPSGLELQSFWTPRNEQLKIPGR